MVLYGMLVYQNIKILLAISISIVIIAFIFLLAFGKNVYYYIINSKKVIYSIKRIYNSIPFLLPIVFVFSIISIICIYKTGNMNPFPYKVDVNLFTFKYSSIYRFVLAISPFGFIVLILLPMFRVSINKLTKATCIFCKYRLVNNFNISSLLTIFIFL